MIAFTIHAYTSDSTEGILVSNNETLSEEEAANYWWDQNKDKGNDPIHTWANFVNIFAIKQDLTEL